MYSAIRFLLHHSSWHQIVRFGGAQLRRFDYTNDEMGR
jgi:hypothetical protein